MVNEQIIARGVRAGRVLDAMRTVPRELFVDPPHTEKAYEDRPLPIGFGQTISQPYVVARMCELLELRGGERALEVGAGSGYQTAILAHLCAQVYGVEIVPALAEKASQRLLGLSLVSAKIGCFDGTYGWREHAPFDAILVAAGAPRVPVLLLDQLVDGGRMVLPVGERDRQRLALVTRRGSEFETRYDSPVRFVDLVGRYGWGGLGPAAA
jgi:protein-L-isoaspartate(D-aspartate) O-methyltransferase